MRGEYDRRRRLIVDGFNEMGLTCFEPRGAFYAFPSIKVTGMSDGEFCETLLREERSRLCRAAPSARAARVSSAPATPTASKISRSRWSGCDVLCTVTDRPSKIVSKPLIKPLVWGLFALGKCLICLNVARMCGKSRRRRFTIAVYLKII